MVAVATGTFPVDILDLNISTRPVGADGLCVGISTVRARFIATFSVDLSVDARHILNTHARHARAACIAIKSSSHRNQQAAVQVRPNPELVPHNSLQHDNPDASHPRGDINKLTRTDGAIWWYS